MSLARAASAFIERRPNATTVAAAMARGAAGDACAQRAEDHGTWDARRCATFMMWSTGVAFALDRYVYSHLFARWWPRNCFRNVLKATAADNIIITPCLYFPFFTPGRQCVKAMRCGAPRRGTGRRPSSSCR